MGNGTTVISLGSDYDTPRAVALEAALSRVDGVDHVEFNYTNNRIIVRFDPDRTSLKELVELVAREKRPLTNSVTKSVLGGVRRE